MKLLHQLEVMTTSINSNSSEPVLISGFREDFLSAQSFRGTDRNKIVAGAYEVAILAVSWDRRCLSLAQATAWSAKRGVLIVQSIVDPEGLCEDHKKRLQQLLHERCETLEIINGPEAGFDGVWDCLYAIGVEEAKRKSNPSVFLLDLSAMSRYYSTGLLAMIVRLGLAARTDCFYAEGRYDAKHAVGEVVFSGGKWRRKAVPFLDGHSNPSLGWYYVVAAGFDGKWIKKILLQEEPDRVGILVPIPGVARAYEQRCLDEIEPIIKEFIVPPEFITRAHAGDAVEAWQKLTALNHERWEHEQIAYLCCGTKPHAVAMALRALVHRFPAVLYFLPEKYAVIPVEETGVFWRYSIVDHSSLSFEPSLGLNADLGTRPA